MIRLTFVASSLRGSPEEFDTDHAGEALGEAFRKWYASGDQHPSEATVVAVVIERDGNRLSRNDVADRLADITAMERTRAHDEELRR